MVKHFKHLSSGLEDYLEVIYIAYLNNIPLKGADLARKLNISRASVSEGLAKLTSKKYVEYSSYGIISITEKGINEAAKIYCKHNLLKFFFENILAVNKSDAEQNACKIEHIVSQEILDKISLYIDFCNNNPEITEKYKEYTLQICGNK